MKKKYERRNGTYQPKEQKLRELMKACYLSRRPVLIISIRLQVRTLHFLLIAYTIILRFVNFKVFLISHK